MSDTFAKQDRVLWSHSEATKHATGSILRGSVAESVGDGLLGTVLDVANDEGTYFTVELDDGRTLDLTSEEIVKVDESS